MLFTLSFLCSVLPLEKGFLVGEHVGDEGIGVLLT